MDYTGYQDFPFPQSLSEEERRLKADFLALPDDRQLSLLNGCLSYEEFRLRLSNVL